MSCRRTPASTPSSISPRLRRCARRRTSSHFSSLFLRAEELAGAAPLRVDLRDAEPDALDGVREDALDGGVRGGARLEGALQLLRVIAVAEDIADVGEGRRAALAERAGQIVEVRAGPLPGLLPHDGVREQHERGRPSLVLAQPRI